MRVNDRITSGCKFNLTKLLLVLALLISPSLACDSKPDPTITLGQTEIKLLEPPGLIRIPQSDPHFGEIVKDLLREPGARVEALYVDPGLWKAYLDGLTPQGPTVPMDYYAALLSYATLDKYELKPEQFDVGIKKVSLAEFNKKGAEVLADQSRFYTVLLDEDDPETGDGVRQINTALLVQKKVLVLLTASWAKSEHKYQAEKIALDWRDAYLKQTEP